MSVRTKVLATVLAVGTTAALACCTTTSATADSVVQTDRGAVRGLVGEDTRTFRGIPYAAPPTGDWRWRSPRPAAKWSGIREATSYADACAQVDHPIGVASTSEDCLYLDVTTPKRPGKNRP